MSNSPYQLILNTVYFILLGVFVYYIIVRKPEIAREGALSKFLKGLKKNDEVITSSGIYGRVISVKQDFITIEIAPNVRIKVKPEHLEPLAPGALISGSVASEDATESDTNKIKNGK